MLRRILTIGMIVLGVAVIALAAASATLWRSSETVTAAVVERPDEPLVITDAGMLDVVADDVTIRVRDPEGGPVVLAVGREADVLAWVGESPHTRITGLASWTDLATRAESGEGEGDAGGASPQGSDMWVVEATGDGEASIEWTHPGGRWSMLAATDGTAPAPVVELSWPQEVSTPFLVPGLVVGVILLLAGLGLVGASFLERREVRRRDEARAERAGTGELPAVATDAPTEVLTRRQLRDLAAAQAAEPRTRPDGPSEAAVVGEETAQEPASPPSTPASASPWRRAWGMRTAGGAPEAADPPRGGDEPTDETGTDEEGKA